MEVVVISIEVKEGLEATSRQSAPLDERLIGIHARLELDAVRRGEAVRAGEARKPIIGVDAAAVDHTEALAGRSPRAIPRAGTAADVDLHEGAKESPIRRGASVQVHARESVVPDSRVRMSARLIPFQIKLGLAADLDAGVGAGNVEKARAIDVADADVVHGRRLLCWKIGGQCPADGDQTCGGPQQNGFS